MKWNNDGKFLLIIIVHDKYRMPGRNIKLQKTNNLNYLFHKSAENMSVIVTRAVLCCVLNNKAIATNKWYRTQRDIR